MPFGEKGGIFTHDFKGVAGFDASGEVPPNATPIEIYDFIDESVIFAGFSFLAFGHLLLEGLSRLWYIVQNPTDTRKVAFMGLGEWGEKTLTKKCYYTFLKMLKVPKERVIFIEKPTKFRQICVPDVSMASWKAYFTREYPALYKAFAKGANELCEGQPKYDKIYLSHGKWTHRKEQIFLNEQIYEDFFVNLGFELIFPEDLSIEKMAYLVHNASQIATTMGTSAHYALFAKENSRFIILTREASTLPPSFPLTAQCLINQAMRTNFFIINANVNFLPSFSQSTGWGVVNFDFTQDFKDFVADNFEGDFSEIYAKTHKKFLMHDNTKAYLQAFAKFYAQPEHFKRALKGLSAFDFVNKLNEVFFAKTLDKSLFEDDLKSINLQNHHINLRLCFEYLFKHKIYHNLFKKPAKFLHKKLIFNLFIKPIFWLKKRNLKA